ncbi:hypothetical protein DY000_02017373 [Brassica cretica]|uniref:Uncharacterized protein n=1 Tax=Brassica cretica TaxID=69181 RepID=A0ABQ7DBH8_BRACR|nr:hypothetical protein DY000_02017373 [Brassica cretica]
MNLRKVWGSVWSRSNSCKDSTKAIQCLAYFCRMISSESEELSFMRVYGQRAQVPDSIIIDGICFLLSSLCL